MSGNNNSDSSFIEYALVLVLVAIVVLALLALFGPQINQLIYGIGGG